MDRDGRFHASLRSNDPSGSCQLDGLGLSLNVQLLVEVPGIQLPVPGFNDEAIADSAGMREGSLSG